MESSIPKPRVPTNEELKQLYEKEYQEIHRVTDMNIWYDKLKDLTIPSRRFDLPKWYIFLLLSVADGKPIREDLPLTKKLNKRIQEKVFVKLNTRSPKDVCDCVFDNGHSVVNALCSSIRIFEDLCMFANIDAQCSIWLRDYVKMRPEGEWRCFVRGGKLIGISQYFYQETFEYDGTLAQVTEDIQQLYYRIAEKFEEKAFVFDVYCDPNADTPLLIEINPYGASDPCLFTYKELEESEHVKIKHNV